MIKKKKKKKKEGPDHMMKLTQYTQLQSKEAQPLD